MHHAGVVWCTILGYGSNFDITGNLEYRAISWPSSSSSDSWRDVAADALFKSSYKDAPEQFFRSNGGKCWAPLANMREANKYFKQIEETGVLSLFPLGQPMQGEPRPTPTVSDPSYGQAHLSECTLACFADIMCLSQDADSVSMPRLGDLGSN